MNCETTVIKRIEVMYVSIHVVDTDYLILWMIMFSYY